MFVLIVHLNFTIRSLIYTIIPQKCFLDTFKKIDYASFIVHQSMNRWSFSWHLNNSGKSKIERYYYWINYLYTEFVEAVAHGRIEYHEKRLKILRLKFSTWQCNVAHFRVPYSSFQSPRKPCTRFKRIAKLFVIVARSLLRKKKTLSRTKSPGYLAEDHFHDSHPVSERRVNAHVHTYTWFSPPPPCAFKARTRVEVSLFASKSKILRILFPLS